MKCTKLPPVAQLESLLDVCADISKSKLNVYFEIGDRAFDDEWRNSTRQIEKKLKQCERLAQEHGLRGLRVVCEPSGGYEKKLLQTARRMGHLTAYVNGEAVAKFRVVETNDNGKTDIRDPHIISTLAKLIGETGPINDFATWRMLLRYGGLNIQMRQSGQYRGQYRISKKGRPLLRKILAQIVLPLVRRKCLYGEYYHHKRESMPGQKAMVAVMRLFLRKFHGWYRSGKAFDLERHFTSVSQTTLREAA